MAGKFWTWQAREKSKEFQTTFLKYTFKVSSAGLLYCTKCLENILITQPVDLVKITWTAIQDCGSISVKTYSWMSIQLRVRWMTFLPPGLMLFSCNNYFGILHGRGTMKGQGQAPQFMFIIILWQCSRCIHNVTVMQYCCVLCVRVMDKARGKQMCHEPGVEACCQPGRRYYSRSCLCATSLVWRRAASQDGGTGTTVSRVCVPRAWCGGGLPARVEAPQSDVTLLTRPAPLLGRIWYYCRSCLNAGVCMMAELIARTGDKSHYSTYVVDNYY